ncbi:Xaa-Pro dipeptidyl-peptidase [Limosilactobacillus frumenti DSM 13145]|uniref:Xaa-Pro dipeptidyl-peptidase n=1 Tax=Limosilactobacillus frumenti DSM 13145 TaxID=1423746 RepID=A0A0R1P5X7_9LACO|nr:Xaa-Pro dipeptidyl-peptidase [Limosilactobacillus frumenti]KRL27969.1 Xaa-Pro dipeptidyl-peptidase [Limosilactobacillus frumenti DSM 13145]MBA2913537.1 Xaa-Pro dipeptidyl-peptidase [Limosilactobacillus frumenti]QFG73195.1 Xaa-Pro dipeptidyl-peptidase [Limosilactobacillus frumenti]
MHIHQFSICQTSTEQQIKELQQLHLLRGNEANQLDPNQMWLTFLTRVNTASQEPIAIRQWLHDLLATADQAVDDWLADDEPLTTDIFYRVAFQLLQYEPAVDFHLDQPFMDWTRIGLPYRQYTTWTTADVIDAFYLLLNTRNKNGQIYLDQLTSEGFLAWTYKLPADQKPLFFNGKPVACFDPAQFIREVVYIETDLDTDFDGHADLVKAEIMRPVDTEHGLKVPAVFTASPYNQGTNDEWGDISTHHVNHPLIHKDPNYHAPTEMTFPAKSKHQLVAGHSKEATESFATTPAYTLNNYLAVRGYAIVYAAGIGTKDSDGLQTCGSPEQTDSMKAVVEWLHGDRRAFTDRHSGIEIDAWWCNGNVAMTGRSYLGTLSTAVATTGVAGLKAIISEAAISSWYDYYRENGLVRAAGGFQGEDADTLADETFSRTKRPADYKRIEATYQKYAQQMAKAMDRATGNYNAFWDARNYRKYIKGIKCAVMMVHGLNDTNVKPSNVKALYDGLQQLPVTSKLILHQGQHIYINAFQSLDFSEMVNLWLANKLWGLDNDADRRLPNVLVQDNVSAEKWTAYDHWTGASRRWYLSGNQLTNNPVANQDTQSFDDEQPVDKYKAWCQSPAKWQRALMKDNGQFSRHFTSAPVSHELLLRGTPTLTIKVASSLDHGLLSAELVDLGAAQRLTTSPVLINRGGLQLGFHWATDDLREFKQQKKTTAAKVISSGHINLQNRHSAGQVDELAANQMVTVSFDLQPIFHRLVKGHRLGLIIYGTDYEFTLRGNEAVKYTLDVNDAQLTIQ